MATPHLNVQIDSTSGNEVPQKSSGGGAHINLRTSTGSEISQEDSESVIEQIPSTTNPATTVTAGSFFRLADFTDGVIEWAVTDGTPAGNLAGTLQISYTMDDGVIQTPYETIGTLADLGANDTQTIKVKISTLSPYPSAKTRTVFSAGTLTAVVSGVKVYGIRHRG